MVASDTQATSKEAVYLRLYDLSDGAARTWSPVLLGKRIEGVFHSGLLLYGMEYFYGGGIVKMKPEDVETSYGITPLRVHHLGDTTVTQREFERYLLSIKPNFTRELYDLTDWNCNHFTDHACRFLLNSRGIPAYILELPKEITNTFMGKIIVNFIKMFSDAPAVDSDAANHPKQTLNASLTRNGAAPGFFTRSSGRRNSCPGSPQKRGTAGDGTRQLTTSEACNLDALRMGGSSRNRRPSLSDASQRGASCGRGDSGSRRRAGSVDKLTSTNTNDKDRFNLNNSSNAGTDSRSVARRSRRSSVPSLMLGHSSDLFNDTQRPVARDVSTPPPIAAGPLSHRGRRNSTDVSDLKAKVVGQNPPAHLMVHVTGPPKNR